MKALRMLSRGFVWLCVAVFTFFLMGLIAGTLSSLFTRSERPISQAEIARDYALPCEPLDIADATRHTEFDTLSVQLRRIDLAAFERALAAAGWQPSPSEPRVYSRRGLTLRIADNYLFVHPTWQQDACHPAVLTSHRDVRTHLPR